MLLNGKAVSAEIKKEIKREIEELTQKGHTPRLDVVLVGNDSASQIYTRNKERACERLGLKSQVHHLPEQTTQEELHSLIYQLNENPDVDGIILQLPLPAHLDSHLAVLQLAPEKDVDGLHPINLGRLLAGLPGHRPCTPQGCLTLLENIDFDFTGKKAVVIGRSILVGKPIALMLLNKNATVTVCHSKTKNLKKIVQEADIVVAATGKPHLIKGDWIKEGAVVLDVGINTLEDGSLVGDVEFESAQKRAYAITPVPGGVGPMTIAMLLKNTVTAARNLHSL